MKKQSGLTLIEVLIASVILFMVIALVTVAYQQNYQSQLKAIGWIDTAAEFRSDLTRVRFQFAQGQRKGDWTTPTGKRYWQATELKRAAGIMVLDPENSAAQTDTSQYVLYEITVTNEQELLLWQIKLGACETSARLP